MAICGFGTMLMCTLFEGLKKYKFCKLMNTLIVLDKPFNGLPMLQIAIE